MLKSLQALMPVSLKAQLCAVFAAVGLLFMVSVGVSWLMTREVQRQVSDICDRTEPLRVLAFEMEINVLEVGMGVLQYVTSGEPAIRLKVAEDWLEFEEFARQYVALVQSNHPAATPVERRTLPELWRLGDQHHQLGAAVMDHGDAWRVLQEMHLAAVEESLQWLERLEREQAGLPATQLEPERAAALGMLRALLRARASTLADFTSSQQAAPGPPSASGEEVLAELRGFAWRKDAEAMLRKLEQAMEHKISLRRGALELRQTAATDLAAFQACQGQLDGLLDDELQASAHGSLQSAKARIFQGLALVERTTLSLLGLTLAFVLGALLVLLRGFRRRLAALLDGARRLECGELSARIAGSEAGELGALVTSFNRVAAAREQAETGLLEAGGQLEDRVRERTAELRRMNEELMREVAERQAAESRLRHSENNLRALINSAADYAIFRLDLEGRVASWNASARRIYGYAEEAVLGQFFSLFHPEEERTAVHLEELLGVARDKGHAQRTGWCCRGDGSRFMASYVINPILDGEGRINGFCKVTRDISEEHRVEEERARLERQLQQNQKMESIGTLAAGISHDFNNILAVIMGHAELVRQRGAVPAESLPSLEKVLAAGERASNLVKQIQQFSRNEKVEFCPVDLGEITTETLDLLKGTLPSTMELRLELGLERAIIQGHAGQLQQVLINLATNARDALPNQTGVLTFRLDKERARNGRATPEAAAGLRHVRLTVTDNGCGMSAATLARIFDPFFTTKPVGQGTGLGLAVAHGILKAHQADIKAYSEPGRGTTFQCVFPLADTEALSPSTGFFDRKQVLGAGQNILVVEDEPELRACVRLMLESHGYQVTEAASGREALEQLESGPVRVDLMLTDKTMPEMDGLELVRHAHDLAPGLPIILTSGLLGEPEQELLTRGWIHSLLPKPVEMKCLLRTVFQAVSARPQRNGKPACPEPEACLH